MKSKIAFQSNLFTIAVTVGMIAVLATPAAIASGPAAVPQQRSLAQPFLGTSMPQSRQAISKGTTLITGEYLGINDSLQSDNGLYKAIMQADGNFVVYKDKTPVWTSSTNQGAGSYFAAVEADGNFVLYTGTPERRGARYWTSNTIQAAGTYLLKLGNDGSLAVYRQSAVLGIHSPAPPASPQVRPSFPITGSQENGFGNAFMHTDVTITRNGDGSGYANGVTHIWEITDLRGFRGSVAVAVLDQNKKLLWVSRTLSYGVDGRLIGTSDRTVNWNDTVPGQLMPQIRYIAIIQKPSPDVYDDISRWLKGIGSVADELAPIIKAVMTVLAG